MSEPTAFLLKLVVTALVAAALSAVMQARASPETAEAGHERMQIGMALEEQLR